MTCCSSFVHDESGAVNSGIPDPPTVESDFKGLGNWVGAIPDGDANSRERLAEIKKLPAAGH
jgi:hypothetical protein